MSIIPPIERPLIEPNVSGETVLFGSLTIAQNQVLYGTGTFSRMYWSDHNGIDTVNVAGTVWSAPQDDVANGIAGFYINHIIVSGVVAAEGSAAYSEFGQGNANAIGVGGAGQSVTNSGTIYAATDVGLATALSHWGLGVAIENSGVIAARTGAVVVDNGSIMSAMAVTAYNGAYLHNAATGQILAEGINATAILMGRGDVHWPSNAVPDTPPQITNDGVIKAASLDPGFKSVGILAAHLEHEVMRIVNNGLIEADVAIRGESATWPYTAAHPWILNSATGTIRGDIETALGQVTLINQGLFEGDASLGLGNDKVLNSGQIVGDVGLGGDADIYDGRLGRIVGTVLGEDGNDLLQGGSGRDALDGGAGADALFARGGDTLTGGAGGDTFVFTAVTAGAAAETITDFVSGSDRIDLRRLAPSSVTINGTTVTAVTAGGTLTIAVGAPVTLADILSNPAAAGPAGTAGDDALVAGPQGAVLIGGAGADLLVGGTGNDRLDGAGNGDMMVGGAGDDTYTVNDQALDDVFEEAGAGYDTIELSGGVGALWTPYIVPVHVERVIGGGAIGNTLDNVLVGSAAEDMLRGQEGNDTIAGRAGADQLQGGDGFDFADYRASTAAVTVSLATATAAGGDAQGDTIATFEGIYGSALGDVLTGDGLANTLRGEGGNDTLDGGAGNDLLEGGAGDDTYRVDSLLDRVTEVAGGGGSDRILVSFSYTLAGGLDVERLATSNAAATAAISLTGNAIANQLEGNAGANVLDGRGGADTLSGLGGDDSYYVDNPGDAIVEVAGGGSDRVFAATSYALGAAAAVERMYTANNAGTTAINLTGNGIANTITGNAGANTLDGRGGADVLMGLGGDDNYYVDSATDAISETAGNGTSDRVYASVSYALAASADVERMYTTDSAGTAAINLTGSAIANLIYGNAGANLLDGRGGIDTLVGYGGDDGYYVDNAADVIVETAGNGTSDRVFASVSYALAASADVERMYTTNNAGTAAISLTGNSLANIITGNAGANVLDGKGGADILVGLAGADSFAFTTALGAGNVDAISGFVAADDMIRLENAVFTGLAAGALTVGAFNTGSAATQADDRIIYNSANGAMLFDVDGVGGAAAVHFATLAGAPALTSADFLVV